MSKSLHDLQYLTSDHLWTIPGIPLKVNKTRGKPDKGDLNSFINIGHRKAQNGVKQRYTKLLQSMFPKEPTEPYSGLVKLLYVYYAPDKRIRDLGNMCALLMKFSEDALVQSGFLTDDNTKHIQNIHFAYGGLDPSKFNHVDLHIFKDD